jgi:hypothetical protein
MGGVRSFALFALLGLLAVARDVAAERPQRSSERGAVPIRPTPQGADGVRPTTRTGDPDAAFVAPRRFVIVDSDDDDDDGIADLRDQELGEAALSRLVWLPKNELEPSTRAPESAPFRLVDRRGEAFAPGKPLRGERIGVQGLRAGSGGLRTSRGLSPVAVLELRALDSQGKLVDLARSHASLTRVLPEELGEERPDTDALRWLVIGVPQELPQGLQILSIGADGKQKDSLGPVPLSSAECPQGTDPELQCRVSPYIRASTDVVDRGHPAAADRSILAEVGGRLRVEVTPGVGASLRVGGPRGLASMPVGRYRVRVRAHVLRAKNGGTPAVGADVAEARRLLEDELSLASALWGQCGVHFGPVSSLDIHVVDTPPAHLLAVGCSEGLPASGGTMRVRVDGRVVELETRRGELPLEVAGRLAERIRQAGYVATVSPNARTSRVAERSADVLVRGRGGQFARLDTPANAPVSSDPSLPVCLGEVSLEDGLHHFTDFDAASGTVEERALIKAVEDDDPATLELIVVPTFAGAGRIGESFIFGPGTSAQNAVILDRAGVRAGARSFTLAHELGHILLDMPGHPDDYGVDTPSSLMDADAADSTIFGPRRLSIEECERTMRQSGPGAPVPLLEPWPLFAPPKSTN